MDLQWKMCDVINAHTCIYAVHIQMSKKMTFIHFWPFKLLFQCFSSFLWCLKKVYRRRQHL